jgi:CheY-like chemotaxis protein
VVTVLVVGNAARSIAHVVQQMGHETRALASEEGAKRLLTREKISVLIAELQSGSFDLLRTAKMYSRGTRVLFVAANASASDYKRAIEEGALDVLVEPVNENDVQAALHRALGMSEGTKSIIHELSLTDLLQIMHMGRRSVTIKVSPGEGRVHMSAGQIVHASHYGLSGRVALRSILASEATTIVTAPATDVIQSIEDNFEMLLLDLMREIDERRKNEPSIDIVVEEVSHEPVPVEVVSAEVVASVDIEPLDDEPLPEAKDRFATSFVIAMVLIAIVIGISEALTWWT